MCRRCWIAASVRTCSGARRAGLRGALQWRSRVSGDVRIRRGRRRRDLGGGCFEVEVLGFAGGEQILMASPRALALPIGSQLAEQLALPRIVDVVDVEHDFQVFGLRGCFTGLDPAQRALRDAEADCDIFKPQQPRQAQPPQVVAELVAAYYGTGMGRAT